MPLIRNDEFVQYDFEKTPKPRKMRKEVDSKPRKQKKSKHNKLVRELKYSVHG